MLYIRKEMRYNKISIYSVCRTPMASRPLPIDDLGWWIACTPLMMQMKILSPSWRDRYTGGTGQMRYNAQSSKTKKFTVLRTGERFLLRSKKNLLPSSKCIFSFPKVDCFKFDGFFWFSLVWFYIHNTHTFSLLSISFVHLFKIPVDIKIF